MKVNILVQMLNRIGGVPRTAIEETKGLNKLGHKAVCYSFIGKKGTWEIFDDVPIELYPNIHFPLFSQSLNPWLASRLPHKINADVVVCHNAATFPVGYRLNEKKGIKFVPYVHDLFGYAHPLAISSTFRHNFFRPKEIRMQMEHLSKADLILVNSSYRIDQLLEFHPTLNDNLKILHPAVHPIHLSNVEREDYILVVTRIHRGKRLEFLIDVVSKMPDIKLVIAGTPTPHLSVVQKKINELKLTKRVKIYSPVSEKQLRRLYLKARVLVHANEEGFGMPALEALAHGCPIIHPYPSGIWDLAEDGIHGFKFSQGDSPDFIDKIERLMCDFQLAEKMGENGISLAERNSWEIHNKKLESYLLDLE